MPVDPVTERKLDAYVRLRLEEERADRKKEKRLAVGTIVGIVIANLGFIAAGWATVKSKLGEQAKTAAITQIEKDREAIQRAIDSQVSIAAAQVVEAQGSVAKLQALSVTLEADAEIAKTKLASLSGDIESDITEKKTALAKVESEIDTLVQKLSGSGGQTLISNARSLIEELERNPKLATWADHEGRLQELHSRLAALEKQIASTIKTDRALVAPAKFESIVGLAVNLIPGCTSKDYDGCDDIWSPELQRSLTYCVSRDFGSNYESVVRDMRAAADAWEEAADIAFIHVVAEDENCSPQNDNVVFDVRPVDVNGKYLMSTFFPHEPRVERSILIDQSAFALSGNLTLVGAFRHGLGRVLGFRNEHTRPESGACFEDNNWRALSKNGYNPASVMHYPQCNGTGDWSLTLTQSDKLGAACIYGAAPGFEMDPDTCRDE